MLGLIWVHGYVDDTVSYIKEESTENISSKLNGFHNDIKFTYGIEKDGKLPFLDVLAIRKDYEIEATVYYKNTNNDVFTGSRFPQQHEN